MAYIKKENFIGLMPEELQEYLNVAGGGELHADAHYEKIARRIEGIVGEQLHGAGYDLNEIFGIPNPGINLVTDPPKVSQTLTSIIDDLMTCQMQVPLAPTRMNDDEGSALIRFYSVIKKDAELRLYKITIGYMKIDFPRTPKTLKGFISNEQTNKTRYT